MAKDEVKIRFAAETKEFNDGIKNMNSDMATLRSELKLNSTQLKAAAGDTILLKERLDLLSNEHEKSKEKIELTNQKLQKAKELYGEDSQEVKKYERALADAKNQEAAIQNEINKTTQELIEQQNSLSDAAEKLTNFGEGAEAAGEKMLAVSGAIAGVAIAAGKTAMDFEDSMAKLNTIADDSAVSINGSTMDMESAIKELSNETGIAATEIAESVYDSISAGQNTADSVTFVQTATKLAAGGFAKAGNAVDLLTTILNAYGMEASEVNTVSDMLINTQNLGKTTVAELSTAMGKIIPTANATNTSLEQVCAGYALMTANGVATAETTTYMNSMLNELSKTGSDVDVVLRDKTGKSFAELMDSGSSVADCLAIINEHAKEQNLTMSDMFSSSEAAKAGLILLGDSAETFNETVKSMKDSTGATNKAFETVSDTVSHKGKVALNELKNTGIELGTTLLDELAPTIDDVCDKIESAADWFSGLNSEQQGTVLAIGGIVAAAGPALIIVGKVAQGVGTITKAVGAAKAAWATYTAAKTAVTTVETASTAAQTAATAAQTASTAATTGATVAQTGLNTALLASPITWVVLAIVGLVAAFVTLWNKCEGFRNFWTGLWDGIKGAASTIADGVKGVFSGISEGFSNMKSSIEEHGGGIKGALGAAGDAIKNNWKKSFELMDEATDGKLSDIKANIEEHGGGIKGAIGAAGDAIKERWTDVFKKVDETTGGKLSDTLSTVKSKMSAMKASVEAHGGGIKGFMSATSDSIKTNWTNAFIKANEASGGKLGELAKTVKDKIEGIKETFSNGLGKVKDFFDNLKLELPKIKLPHFKLDGEFDLGKGKVPSLKVEWYAKGAVLTKPTIFGMNGNNPMVGGEAGAEAILPIDTLQDYIDIGMSKFVSSVPTVDYDRMEEALTRALLKTDNKIVLNERVLGRTVRSLI